MRKSSHNDRIRRPIALVRNISQPRQPCGVCISISRTQHRQLTTDGEAARQQGSRKSDPPPSSLGSKHSGSLPVTRSGCHAHHDRLSTREQGVHPPHRAEVARPIVKLLEDLRCSQCCAFPPRLLASNPGAACPPVRPP